VITACSGNFSYVPVGSDPGTPFSGDLEESDLDLEWTEAIARNAQIIFVTAPSAAGTVTDAYLYAIDNDVAPVLSLSYGLCELAEVRGGTLASDEAEFQKAAGLGITFVNSSGDVGAAGCDFGPPNPISPYNPAVNGLAVSYPASSQWVTGVGGTMIPRGEYTSTYWSASNGTDGGSALGYIPENGWNDDSEIGAFCAANPNNSSCKNPSGTTGTPVPITNAQTFQENYWISIGGGGASNCTAVNGSGICTGGFAQPSWQQVTIPGQSSARFVPDVSLLASPDFPGYILCTPLSELSNTTNTASSCASSIANAITANNSFIGGTSVSAPVFAGMVTLLNQYLQGASSSGLGLINPKLYSLAKIAPTAFHQVTGGLNAAGSNVVYCKPGTPAGFPTSYQCPTGGSMGFFAANADAATGYNLVTGLGSVDLNNLAVAWAANRSASVTTVQANPTQITLGQSTTLTATVTPSSATGTVTFSNTNGSTTALGGAPLTLVAGAATATLTTSSLPVGTNSITASYGGDTNNAPSTSAVAALVTVVAPTFTFANTGASSHTAMAGQKTMNYSFLATPTSSATFEGSVTLSCSFAPTDTTLTGSACVFSPSSTIAAGSGATAVTLSIQTAGPNTGTGAATQPRADKRSPWLPLVLPIAGVVVVGLVGRKVSKHSVLAGLCVSLVLLGVLIACGGSSAPVMVTVNPASASLYPNNTGWPAQTQSFSASVANTNNTAVTWSVPSGGGSIDGSGNYTAPMIAAGLPSSVTVTATSQAGSASGTAMVTLKPATVPATYTVTVKAREGASNAAPSNGDPTVKLVAQ
jgi:subtilase family serine protease